MRTVLKFKWPIMILLIALTATLFLMSPNLTEQAEEAGSFQLSEDASSQVAVNLLEVAGEASQNISLVLQLESEVTEESRTQVAEIVQAIESFGDPVSNVLDPFESAELEEQLVSEDGQTILVPITVSGTDEEVQALASEIRETVLPENMTAYVTGQAIINHDVNLSAQEGLRRTEIITVILIFGLLLAVFRSAVTPFIPLVAVGISYLLSQSIVAYFIDWFGFPVSNYTQIFLVAILFGIGTDYCILLLSRYKEELSTGRGVEESIINTYRTAGRTLFISGVSGFIAFLAIGFADFPIFKSAVAVAVGIFVLMIVLFTVVPFFMALLKEKLFWPSKKSASHSDSKIWIWIGKLSVNRPLLSMGVVALITIPLLFTYNDDLSFNTVDEIGSEYESVQGLQAIEEAFGSGNSLPVQVVLQSDEALTDESTVPYFESLSRDIEKVEGVEEVRAITRPTGSVIDEFTVDFQLGLLSEGVTDAGAGLSDVQEGLGEIEETLAGISQQTGAEGVSEAAAGLGGLNEQLNLTAQGLQQTGDVQQTVGAIGQISGGLTEIQQGLQAASGQLGELGPGLAQLAEGIGASNDGLAEIESGLVEAADMMQQMSDSETVRDTGLFIPEGTLEEADLASLLETYTFAGDTGMVMEVILSEDPYSPEAIDIVGNLKETVSRAIVNTPIEGSVVAFGGISSINSDLAEVSSNDFTRTVTIMLVSLLVVLMVLLRSLIMPIYMIASLLLTYYTSLAITELIFVNGLGYDGITWAVPFFGFVMLVALGVDYSIFLLDRFQEEAVNGVHVMEAMRTSMAKMGTVIITAAIILAGTFGAMMPSGVLSLMQIATIVITGLLLYGLIVLPLLIPAVTVSFGRGAWWPFNTKNR